MTWKSQLHGLSLRTKILITVIGAAFAALGGSTYLSFTYWQKEARAVAEQQALLAAKSTRMSIEGALNRGDYAEAQATLKKMVRGSALTAARVHDVRHDVLLSSDDRDLVTPRARVWIPSARELPRDGTARVGAGADAHSVHAFIPIGSRLDQVLEVELSMAVVATAMERGSRLGIGLLIVSLLVVALVLYAMIQRKAAADRKAADKQEKAAQTVLEQAETLSQEWALATTA